MIPAILVSGRGRVHWSTPSRLLSTPEEVRHALVRPFSDLHGHDTNRQRTGATIAVVGSSAPSTLELGSGGDPAPTISGDWMHVAPALRLDIEPGGRSNTAGYTYAGYTFPGDPAGYVDPGFTAPGAETQLRDAILMQGVVNWRDSWNREFTTQFELSCWGYLSVILLPWMRGTAGTGRLQEPVYHPAIRIPSGGITDVITERVIQAQLQLKQPATMDVETCAQVVFSIEDNIPCEAFDAPEPDSVC